MESSSGGVNSSLCLDKYRNKYSILIFLLSYFSENINFIYLIFSVLRIYFKPQATPRPRDVVFKIETLNHGALARTL